MYVRARPNMAMRFPGMVIYIQVTFKVKGFYSIKPWLNQYSVVKLHTQVCAAYRHMERYGYY